MSSSEKNSPTGDVEIDLLDTVVLLRPLLERGLQRGQVGAVIELLDDNHVEVEFTDRHGRTYVTAAIDRDHLLKTLPIPDVSGAA